MSTLLTWGNLDGLFKKITAVLIFVVEKELSFHFLGVVCVKPPAFLLSMQYAEYPPLQPEAFYFPFPVLVMSIQIVIISNAVPLLLKDRKGSHALW